MEKDNSNNKTPKIEKKIIQTKKNSKLTDKQKEILITIIVLLICIILGYFLGRLLYQVMYGTL